MEESIALNIVTSFAEQGKGEGVMPIHSSSKGPCSKQGSFWQFVAA